MLNLTKIPMYIPCTNIYYWGCWRLLNECWDDKQNILTTFTTFENSFLNPSHSTIQCTTCHSLPSVWFSKNQLELEFKLMMSNFTWLDSELQGNDTVVTLHTNTRKLHRVTLHTQAGQAKRCCVSAFVAKNVVAQ